MWPIRPTLRLLKTLSLLLLTMIQETFLLTRKCYRVSSVSLRSIFPLLYQNANFSISLIPKASKENTTLSVVRVNDDSGGDNTDVNLTVEEIYNPSTNSVLKENSADTKQLTQDQSSLSENAAIKMNGKIGIEKTDHASDPVPLDVPVPLLDLDQEEIEKIEHALQSEQARQILGGGFGGILGPTGSEAELDDLLDPELTGGLNYFHLETT